MSDAGAQERIEEAQQRLFQHPAYADYLDRHALYTALVHVFRPNYEHLMEVLDAPSKDPKLALELVQNVRRPDVRNAYEGNLIRSLHNHVASSRTLVDIARRAMRGATGKVRDEFGRRRDDLGRHGEVHFINGLRNFMLHRTLPVVGHQISFGGEASQSGSFVARATVSLSTEQLLADDRWSAPARTYLLGLGGEVDLRRTATVHGDLLFDLNAWLHDALAVEAQPGLQALNHLVDEVNAALLGTDIESARAHPLHEMRQRP